MNSSPDNPAITLCTVTYGNYPYLIQQCLDSFQTQENPPPLEILVGANAICQETRQYLHRQQRLGIIKEIVDSPENLNKCPMMRRLFAHVRTPFVWWFDDDSYFTRPDTLNHWLQTALSSPPEVVMWGLLAKVTHSPDQHLAGETAQNFVRQASWFQGLPPPSWEPGGKGEFFHDGRYQGDGNWFFAVGGCWLMRTQTLKRLDWPDPRLKKGHDDVFLGEAIRQQGWLTQHLAYGVAINTHPRRGEAG